MTVIADAAPARHAQTRPDRLRVRVVRTVAEASEAWDALAHTGSGSAYQSRQFLEPWLAHVAPAANIAPRIGLVEDGDGRAIALLPFGIARHGPLRALVYLGGRDSNLNMPLVDPDVAIDQAEASALLRNMARSMSPSPDLFLLANQPRNWNGVRNPFALEKSAPSPSAAFGANFDGDAAAFLAAHESRDARKKLRSKATRLASLGAVAFERASPVSASEIVAAFVAQKDARLARRGIAPPFDTDNMRAFFRSLAAPASGTPALEFYILRVGDTIAAIFGGLPYGTHWHGLINSYADDPAIARCSPGDLLLRDTLADLGTRGFQSFDLGIGEARYKAALCDRTIDLVDTIVPVTLGGQMMAGAASLRLVAKRWIKQRPTAMKTVQSVRGALTNARKRGP